MKIHPKTVFRLLLLIMIISGCAAPRISIFGNNDEPLEEYTLQGSTKGKVLLIPVKGKITDDVESGLIRKKPSMVQEIVAQLKKAENDKDVGAVLLVIDSPGGSVTASDVLYHEIVQFKEKTGRKVVAALMDVAASGGYYIALPADAIVAHPTTITGSVGVLFLQPKVVGLMDKIGVEVQVSKSGANKDIGSPFRAATAQEKKILQEMTDKLARRFLDLVSQHRRIDAKRLAEIASANVYLAEEAQRLGLVDRVGYLNDAVEEAGRLAGLNTDAKVVVYRREKYENDTIYNMQSTWSGGNERVSLIDLGLPVSETSDIAAGFYYLWPTAAGAR
ncbi:MAG: signal peptide peptidase SppA [Desulfobacterales bacterium]